MSDGRGAAPATTFKTGLLPSGLLLPGLPLAIGCIAWVGGFSVAALPFLGIGALAAGLYAGSILRIESGQFTVRMMALRGRTVRMDEIERVYFELAGPSLWQVPAVRIFDRRGTTVSVCLGWWRRESEFLGYLERAIASTGARTDAPTRQILRRRPSGWFWSLGGSRLDRWSRARPFVRQPRDQAVFAIGLADVVLGMLLAISAVVTRSRIRSYGLVPEALAGFEATVLGGIAVALARPPRERRRLFGATWVLLSAAVVSTVATLVVAFDAFGMAVPLDHAAAQLLVKIGQLVITLGLVILLFWWLSIVGQALWRRFLAAGGTRCLR